MTTHSDYYIALYLADILWYLQPDSGTCLTDRPVSQKQEPQAKDSQNDTDYTATFASESSSAHSPPAKATKILSPGNFAFSCSGLNVFQRDVH